MKNFIVTYNHVTLGVNGAKFAENFGYERVQAANHTEAVRKVVRNPKTPKGARNFRARAI